jgi:hypothetical protein
MELSNALAPLVAQLNAEEIGRPPKAGKDINKGTNTHVLSSDPTKFPKGRKPTYLRAPSAPIAPKKDYPPVGRGGDRADYPGNVTTETADLTTSKILFNTLISTWRSGH